MKRKQLELRPPDWTENRGNLVLVYSWKNEQYAVVFDGYLQAIIPWNFRLGDMLRASAYDS